MAMNSSGMTGKIALKKKSFKKSARSIAEIRSEKEAFNEKYEVPVSERPSLLA